MKSAVCIVRDPFHVLESDSSRSSCPRPKILGIFFRFLKNLGAAAQNSTQKLEPILTNGFRI